MTPAEMKEDREERLREYNALKALFGGLLLESKGADPDDVAYYQRKFREAQAGLRRAGC